MQVIRVTEEKRARSDNPAFVGPVLTHYDVDVANAELIKRDSVTLPAIVQAISPRVAIMNNGARKGGEPSAWQIIKDSPGLEDIWQLHYSVAGGAEHNVRDSFIANVDEVGDAGNYLKVSALQDGSFTVYNSRNKFERSYGNKFSNK